MVPAKIPDAICVENYRWSGRFLRGADEASTFVICCGVSRHGRRYERVWGAMTEKRKISKNEIVQDIRSGMTNEELEAKYRVSSEKLISVFKKLVDLEALEPAELDGRAGWPPEFLKPQFIRSRPRQYVVFPLPIYDTDDLGEEGFVKDINESGMQVTGIKAKVGEAKSLLIQADQFADVYPFVFDAACRWYETGDDQDSAGFEITNITERSRNELQKLIHYLTLG